MTEAGFRRKKRGGSRIQGEALLFISGELFLAQAAVLASRFPGALMAGFPVTRRSHSGGGDPGSIAYTTEGKMWQENRQAAERTDWIIHSQNEQDEYNYSEDYTGQGCVMEKMKDHTCHLISAAQYVRYTFLKCFQLTWARHENLNSEGWKIWETHCRHSESRPSRRLVGGKSWCSGW